MNSWKYPAFWIALLLVVIAGILPGITGSDILRENIYLILLAVSLASSLNILLGYAGYVSFGHIVFFGIGGYFGMYLIATAGLNLWIAVVAGGAIAALLAYLLGLAILRLRGAYFALATIGVNEAMRTFINNFGPFGGPIGIELQFQVYKQYGGAATMQWP